MDSFKQRIVESIQKKYGNGCRDFKWVTGETAARSESERASIIESLKESLSFEFNKTKPFYLDISPGCRRCGEGTWSCLFINGKCNGTCFFCPSVQNSISEPLTNAISFQSPGDYLDYLALFNFRGASISGGEPLITFDRTLKFITAIERRFGNSIHKWMYTNGLLLTEDYLSKLKDAGLNEIRLNLFVQKYDPAKIFLAAKYIDSVTVEIPAVPEDYERMRQLLPVLYDAGVKYLNLHQLRCTVYNYKKFIKRGYTFLHDTDVTVLESELTALKLMKNAIDNGLKLPVNYCSFVYRNNFQAIGARRRAAIFIKKEYEDITDTGRIRTLSVKVSGDAADKIRASAIGGGSRESSLFYNQGESKLYFKESILKYIDEKLPLSICYYDVMLTGSASYRNMFRDIKLNKKRNIAAERWLTLPAVELSGDDIKTFRNCYTGDSRTDNLNSYPEKWININLMEVPHKGLKEYW